MSHCDKHPDADSDSCMVCLACDAEQRAALDEVANLKADNARNKRDLVFELPADWEKLDRNSIRFNGDSGSATIPLPALIAAAEPFRNGPWLEQKRIEALEADNARLRALVKQAERADFTGECADRCCPWCSEERGHHETCPAFTPEGSVR